MKKLLLSIGVLLVLIASISYIAPKNKPNEPEDNPVKEATQEEIIIEEKKEDENLPEEEPVEVPLPIPELPEQELEEPEIVLTPQEQARLELVEKYGEEVVDAWERLSRDEFFDYIGYEMIIKEQHSLYGDVYYHCYKILEDGSMEDANVGGNYYIYGIFVSNEAMFDLIDYHNEFFAVK